MVLSAVRILLKTCIMRFMFADKKLPLNWPDAVSNNRTQCLVLNRCDDRSVMMWNHSSEMRLVHVLSFLSVS